MKFTAVINVEVDDHGFVDESDISLFLSAVKSRFDGTGFHITSTDVENPRISVAPGDARRKIITTTR